MLGAQAFLFERFWFETEDVKNAIEEIGKKSTKDHPTLKLFHKFKCVKSSIHDWWGDNFSKGQALVVELQQLQGIEALCI